MCIKKSPIVPNAVGIHGQSLFCVSSSPGKCDVSSKKVLLLALYKSSRYDTGRLKHKR